MPRAAKYDPEQREWDARCIAQELLDVVEWYESFTGRRLDPAHPNARDELRRIGARAVQGLVPFKSLWPPYRKLIDEIIDALLDRLAVRSA